MRNTGSDRLPQEESCVEQAEVVERGTEEYVTTFAAMRDFTVRRTGWTPDQLWLVVHPPVITLGLAADPTHVLDAGAIPVIQSDRGGEVTYHAPGQAIVYLLIDLRRRAAGAGLFVREFVHGIEQAVINTLAAFGLAGERRRGAPGIYMADGPTRGAKIAALGLKVRVNGCTYHGVSLNVAMDLAPYACINVCGDAGVRSTDMRSQGIVCGIPEVQRLLASNLLELVSTRPNATED
ncbi:MAG: lipoyl(octanoyl) transferase LipB [Burkholderiaceae bacterium]